MKDRINVLLASTLILLLCVAFAVSFFKNKDVQQRPTSKLPKPNVPQAVRKSRPRIAKAPPSEAPCPSPAPAGEARYAFPAEPAWPVPPDVVVPEGIVFQTFKFKARVTANGVPVRGAHVQAELVRDPTSSSSPFFGIVEMPQSDREGLAEGLVSLPRGVSPDAEVYVAAFHPELGTDAFVTIVADLFPGDGEPLELKLERGRVITGRVVDSEGRPIQGAALTLFAESRVGQINVSGIGVWTDSDGRFYLPGVRFGNNPDGLLVMAERRFRPSASNGEPGSPRRRSRVIRKSVRIPNDLKDESMIGLGDVTVSLE